MLTTITKYQFSAASFPKFWYQCQPWAICCSASKCLWLDFWPQKPSQGEQQPTERCVCVRQVVLKDGWGINKHNHAPLGKSIWLPCVQKLRWRAGRAPGANPCLLQPQARERVQVLCHGAFTWLTAMLSGGQVLQIPEWILLSIHNNNHLGHT